MPSAGSCWHTFMKIKVKSPKIILSYRVALDRQPSDKTLQLPHNLVGHLPHFRTSDLIHLACASPCRRLCDTIDSFIHIGSQLPTHFEASQPSFLCAFTIPCWAARFIHFESFALLFYDSASIGIRDGKNNIEASNIAMFCLPARFFEWN